MGITEHMRVQKKYGVFREYGIDIPDDCFNPNGAAVVCENCIQDVEIEIES